MNIKLQHNNKLFYKKYAYRFTISNLSSAYACRTVLRTGDYSSHYYNLKQDVYNRFKELYYICEHRDIIARVESTKLSLYSNDKDLIEILSEMHWWCDIELSQPKNDKLTDFLLANSDYIISEELNGFKATISPVPYANVKTLKSWADSQPFILARSIQYKGEGYIIFSDEKYLSLLSLNGNIKIRKIEKIIKESSIA